MGNAAPERGKPPACLPPLSGRRGRAQAGSGSGRGGGLWACGPLPQPKAWLSSLSELFSCLGDNSRFRARGVGCVSVTSESPDSGLAAVPGLGPAAPPVAAAQRGRGRCGEQGGQGRG